MGPGTVIYSPININSGLQLPFAIVTNLEKNIELATMALQLAKTLAPWFFQASKCSHFHIIVVATIILCSPDICVYPPPSRKDENSSQRKPNHPVYSTPSSSN